MNSRPSPSPISRVRLSLAALRLMIAPDRPRPTAVEIIRHAPSDEQRAEINGPALPALPVARRPLTASEWFAQLEEHFPRAYLHAYASDLDELRAVNGCSPREAAAYAKTYMLAPRIVSDDDTRLAGIGAMAAPVVS